MTWSQNPNHVEPLSSPETQLMRGIGQDASNLFPLIEVPLRMV